ncbi:MAG: class I SAM-dependent methyltransferase [bacterium]
MKIKNSTIYRKIDNNPKLKKYLEKLKKSNFYNIIRKVSHSRMLQLFPRYVKATKGLRKKHLRILKWVVKSKEKTNFTYDLTEKNIEYLAHMIANIFNEKYDKIITYINEARNDIELKEYVIMRTENENELNRVSDKRSDFGRRLGWYAIVRQMKPKIVVETGVYNGLGSVLLCYAIMKNSKEGYQGKYYGTEINPKGGLLLGEKYKKYGEILYGDSIKSLKNLDEEIDIFINDSDHSPNYEYQEYQVIKNKLSEKGVLLGDNSHCSDKLSKFSLENNRQFMFFSEEPANHWYSGAGIGISYKK